MMLVLQLQMLLQFIMQLALQCQLCLKMLSLLLQHYITFHVGRQLLVGCH